MSDTPNIVPPLLEAGQAQKHVTMNDALLRLDALGACGVESASFDAPPPGAAEGDCYIVAAPGAGDWTGEAGAIAYCVGGGWEFAAPRPGQKVRIADEGAAAVWLAGAWRRNAIGDAPFGAHLSATTIGGVEVVPAGAGFDTDLAIPDRAVVIGVSAQVTAALTGAGLTGWRIGVAGSTDRYGSGVGAALNSIANGVTGAPVGYYGETPLRIEPEGGSFAGGEIRVAIHYLSLTPPDPV